MAYPSKTDITGKTSSVPLYFPNYKGESLSIRLPNGKLFPGWVSADNADTLVSRGIISKREYAKAFNNRWDNMEAHGPEDLKEVFWTDRDILRALKTERANVAARAPSEALLTFEEKRKAYGGFSEDAARRWDTHYEDYLTELDESISIVEERLKAKPETTVPPREYPDPGDVDYGAVEIGYEPKEVDRGISALPEGRERSLSRQNFAEELKQRMGALLTERQEEEEATSAPLLGENEKTRAEQLGLSQSQVAMFLRKELAENIKDNLRGDRDFYKKGDNLGALQRAYDVGAGLGVGDVRVDDFGIGGFDPVANRDRTTRAVDTFIGKAEANLAKDDAGYGFPSPEKFAQQSAERQRRHDERMKDSRNLLTGEKSALDYLERNKNVANQAPLGQDTIMGRSRAKREAEAQRRKQEKDQRKEMMERVKQIAKGNKDGNPSGALQMTAGY